jgi:hypothetical protein
MRRSIRLAIVVALCVLGGSALRAQTAPLMTADAGKFMGAWVLTLDTPQGPFVLTMTLTDADGKVACELTSDAMPAAQKVTDISKSGNDLVLKYQGDFQGQAFAAKVTLTPVDDKLGVVFDIMDGQFTMSGVGAKK